MMFSDLSPHIDYYLLGTTLCENDIKLSRDPPSIYTPRHKQSAVLTTNPGLPHITPNFYGEARKSVMQRAINLDKTHLFHMATWCYQLAPIEN